jgi:aryl-alcohol dehydrogenase-like predicted oxidoreductase
MKYRPLGKTGLQVSEIGLGCGGRIGAPDLPENDAKKIFNLALDLGVNFLDTGSNYQGGNSELRMGRLLKGRRKNFILATKCGSRMMFEPGKDSYVKRDFTYDGLIRSTEDSLKRLQTDYVDLLQLHTAVKEALVPGSEAIGALLEIKKRGMTRFIGTSNDGERALQMISLGVFDTLQTSYNVVMQEAAAELLPAALKAGIGVIVKEPAANAFFLDRPKPDEDYAYQIPCWERARNFSFLGEFSSPAPVQIALKFVLNHPAVSTAIVATVNPGHLAENVATPEIKPLDQALVSRIKETFCAGKGAGPR